MERKWHENLTFVVGIWLIAWPWLFGQVSQDLLPSGPAATNSAISGVVMAFLSLASSMTRHRWRPWTQVLLSVWLVMSPWALAFQTDAIATWNAIACGAVNFTAGCWTVLQGQVRG